MEIGPARSVARLDQLKHLRAKASESTLTIKGAKNRLCGLIQISLANRTGGLLLEKCQFSLQSGALIDRSRHWGHGPEW
jgi:hypothetical protein